MTHPRLQSECELRLVRCLVQPLVQSQQLAWLDTHTLSTACLLMVVKKLTGREVFDRVSTVHSSNQHLHNIFPGLTKMASPEHNTLSTCHWTFIGADTSYFRHSRFRLTANTFMIPIHTLCLRYSTYLLLLWLQYVSLLTTSVSSILSTGVAALYII